MTICVHISDHCNRKPEHSISGGKCTNIGCSVPGIFDHYKQMILITSEYYKRRLL